MNFPPDIVHISEAAIKTALSIKSRRHAEPPPAEFPETHGIIGTYDRIQNNALTPENPKNT